MSLQGMKESEFENFLFPLIYDPWRRVPGPLLSLFLVLQLRLEDGLGPLSRAVSIS